MCLAKTDSKILSATGETDAPPGPAIFGLSGDDAIVFFPEAHTFARWHNDVLEPLDWEIDGEILSIRATQIAVRRNGNVSIVRPDDSTIDSIPDASGPVLLLPKGVVFATKDEIVLRQDDSEVRFELAGAESITAMGARYVAIRAGGAIYALRIDPGRERLFLLPGNTPVTRTILLALLLPLAARAQIALFTVNNGAEAQIVDGASLNMGKVAAGDTVSVRIRVKNIGTSTANITYFFVDGLGYTLNRPIAALPHRSRNPAGRPAELQRIHAGAALPRQPPDH